MIDTHVHLIDPERFPFPPGSAGYVPLADETGTVEQLLHVMSTHGVSKAVAVAASVYGSDNAAMLDAFARYPDRFRVVAGLDPEDPTSIERLAETPGVAGVRLNLKDDRRFGTDLRIARDLLRRAADADLVISILAPPSLVVDAVEGIDAAKIVLDHLGRPDLDGGFTALRQLARRPGTWLKLSGGFRLARARHWAEPDPELIGLVSAFPSDRLIWGSDWPFINLGAADRPTYGQCLAWARSLSTADFSANARALFWGDA